MKINVLVLLSPQSQTEICTVDNITQIRNCTVQYIHNSWVNSNKFFHFLQPRHSLSFSFKFWVRNYLYLSLLQPTIKLTGHGIAVNIVPFHVRRLVQTKGYLFLGNSKLALTRLWHLAPWLLAPWTDRPMDSSPHGRDRPRDSSPQGQLVPWTARPMDSSPHGELTPW